MAIAQWEPPTNSFCWNPKKPYMGQESIKYIWKKKFYTENEFIFILQLQTPGLTYTHTIHKYMENSTNKIISTLIWWNAIQILWIGLFMFMWIEQNEEKWTSRLKEFYVLCALPFRMHHEKVEIICFVYVWNVILNWEWEATVTAQRLGVRRN